jgi:hypothetical protein
LVIPGLFGQRLELVKRGGSDSIVGTCQEYRNGIKWIEMNMKWMFSDPHPFVAKALFQVSCCKRMRFLCLIPKYSKRLYSMQPLQSKTCPTGLLEFWQVCHEVLPPRWVDSGCINDISHKSSV